MTQTPEQKVVTNLWDSRFLALAEHVAGWSKDPSTQVGAVIVDEDNRIVSTGYNGFPKGIKDTKGRLDNRDKKLQYVIHAEHNAILFANRSLQGCTLYVTPMMPCARCATVIVQSGLKRVVSTGPSKEVLDRWGDDMEIAKSMFDEAGIEFDETF
jgi:dCMP deaminase